MLLKIHAPGRLSISVISAFAVILTSGCATHNGLSIKKSADNRVKIELTEQSELNGDDICNALRYHIIQINPDGAYHPIKTDLSCLGNHSRYEQPEKLEDHLNIIKRRIETGGRAGNGTFNEITFIFHGGLVPQTTGMQEAIRLNRAILMDPLNTGSKRNYPLFINWRSGGIDAYAEQLLKIRKGERMETVGKITAPVKLLSDIGRGISDMPSLGALEGKRLWDTLDKKKFNACTEEHEQKGAICPVDTNNGSKDALVTAKYFLMTPFRILSAPFVNGAGRPAWENMVRRTRNTFWREPRDGEKARRGVVRQAFDHLLVSDNDRQDRFYFKEEQQRCNFGNRKINLIGHSMGTMIANDLLEAYPDCQYQHIVFMAAAVSIREFIQVLPRLLENNQQVEFYNLSLQPRAEAREMSALGFVPSGSLLEWIDEMYTPPNTKFDRTLGKWVNVREILETIPETYRKNMTFRVFGVAEGEPAKHGDFNNLDMCFWRKSFWNRQWSDHYPACTGLLTELGITKGRPLATR